MSGRFVDMRVVNVSCEVILFVCTFSCTGVAVERGEGGCSLTHPTALLPQPSVNKRVIVAYNNDL